MRKDKILAGEPIKDEEGIKVLCKVIKNRLSKGNPFKQCCYYAVYGKGIDGQAELGTVLCREEIVNKKGAWIRFENEEGDVKDVPSENGPIPGKWNGTAAFTKYFKENPCGIEFFEKLLDEKLSGGLGGVSVSEEEVQELKAFDKEAEAIQKEIE